MERDLVTGGTGLVGSHIICELLNHGREVRAVKRSTSNMAHVEFLISNLVDENKRGNLEWMNADITDYFSVEDCVQDCSRVFHSAGFVSFVDNHAEKLHAIHVEGTANIVNACLAQDEKPILCHISSTASLGKPSSEVIDERVLFILSEADSEYAKSKYLAELEVVRGREEGLTAAILNPSIILGFANWDLGSSRFFKNGYRGFPFYTPGANSIVDARDVASAALSLMDYSLYKDRYLCTGTGALFKDVFDIIARSFGRRPPRFRVRTWMARLAWQMAGIKRFFGGSSMLTKASALTAMRYTKYSSEKLINEANFTFRTLDECISFHSALYLKFKQ